MILGPKIALRPKYLLIDRLREDITLSGRRWIPNGISKYGRGLGGGKEGGNKEGRSEEEEIIFFKKITLHFL